MKILLVNPFKETSLGRQSFPPVGLGFLATMVREHYEVKILDCMSDCRNYQDFINQVKWYAPDLIGFNVFSIAVPNVQKMIEGLKILMPKIKIVVGGPHISALPDKVFNYFPQADYAIQGEGEIPFLALLNNLATGVAAPRINKPFFAEDIDNTAYLPGI